MNITVFSKHTVRIMASLLLVCLVGKGFVAIPASASRIPLDQSRPYPQKQVITSGDLEAFTDELLTRQLDEYHIAGATVSIVQDGRTVLAKGYGYADIEKQIPVSPSEAIFRIGSISKLFTWTAVMQLAEQGKIDLNADVNTYLPDFQIPATYPKPITMLNLLSHTAGFEERTIGTESPKAEEMISLHDYLARYMPDRVRPAGELTAYSNYGAALAGYIVEAVSGMPFEQYVETYIFAPISMSHSTFQQPLPSNLESRLATSYSYNGEFVPGSFTYVNLRPAGAMSSTAHDMANFMVAHLQDGSIGNNQILKPETIRQMHSHLFSNDERLDGFAYGFMEWNFNGQRVLWHGGDIGNWHSGLAIIPAQNLGFFVAYNSIEGIPAVNEFYSSFMDAFFPAQEARNPPLAENSTQDVRDLAGEYRSTRSAHNHVERILYFPGNGNVRVAVNPDRTLSIAGYTYYETEFPIYRPVDWMDTVIFHQDGSRKNTHLLFNSLPLFAYERVSWFETSTFNLLAFGACYLLLMTVLLVAFIGIFRRSKGVKVESHIPRIAKIWTFIISVVFLLVPVAIAVFIKFDYKSSFPLYMVIVLAIILAASILVIGPIIFTIYAWVRRYWSLTGRIHYTLVTMAMLGMVWLLYYWRLLGIRY